MICNSYRTVIFVPYYNSFGSQIHWCYLHSYPGTCMKISPRIHTHSRFLIVLISPCLQSHTGTNFSPCARINSRQFCYSNTGCQCRIQFSSCWYSRFLFFLKVIHNSRSFSTPVMNPYCNFAFVTQTTLTGRFKGHRQFCSSNSSEWDVY